MAVGGFGEFVCFLDVVFYRFRQSLVVNAMDACEVGLCVFIVFVPSEMSSNLFAVAT
jgi:hypothetical protein